MFPFNIPGGTILGLTDRQKLSLEEVLDCLSSMESATQHYPEVHHNALSYALILLNTPHHLAPARSAPGCGFRIAAPGVAIM
jgi:hypothetical protein